MHDKLLCQVFKCVRLSAIMKKKIDSNSKITLKSLRESVGLTQPELSQRLNCGIRIISDWENGHKIPRFDNAITLANELGVSLKTLAKSMNLDVSGIPDDIPLEKPTDRVNKTS